MSPSRPALIHSLREGMSGHLLKRVLSIVTSGQIVFLPLRLSLRFTEKEWFWFPLQLIVTYLTMCSPSSLPSPDPYLFLFFFLIFPSFQEGISSHGEGLIVLDPLGCQGVSWRVAWPRMRSHSSVATSPFHLGKATWRLNKGATACKKWAIVLVSAFCCTRGSTKTSLLQDKV